MAGFKKCYRNATVQLKDFHEDSYDNFAKTARRDSKKHITSNA